jgi:tetratricopeptide (TPR) repeat protein
MGTLALALAHGARLLAANPLMAEQQASEILRVAPGHPEALLILATARRLQGDAAGARPMLEALAAAHPNWAAPPLQLGQALAALGDHPGAVAALERACAFDPNLSEAWRALGDQFTALGDTAKADKAYGEHIRASVGDPRLMEAATAVFKNDLAVAERLLKAHLKAFPNDVVAIRLLAEVAGRLGRYPDSEALLARCLELAPGFAAARHNYALVLHRQDNSAEAIAQVNRLLAEEPDHPLYQSLKAAVLGRLGDYDEAIGLYDAVLKAHPNEPKIWMSYGHVLKTAGRSEDGVDAYRRTVALEPSCGEAYWSLANLKTVRFDPADIAAMQSQLTREDLGAEDRFHLHYALGKALEDEGQWQASFEHYARGAELRRELLPYDADETTERTARSKALFTEAFFAERQGAGSDAPDPIFVVGLPRSGSTLVEQILSSHSEVEGTMELPEIIAIVRDIAGKKMRGDPSLYPEILAEMAPDRLRELGERFLDRTRVQRKTNRPLFIDKMPNNFAHIGLIQLILPRAKIIDARRHPMATCFSGFKQHFARGQSFSYNLPEIGRYYRDYGDLMAHYDRVLPGRVHRVRYETMVEDTEGETRRLLDYCGLAFEPGCLRFYENERAVRTASSEQVRRPIFREGVDHWKHYEPWLGPLKTALGPVVQAYEAEGH